MTSKALDMIELVGKKGSYFCIHVTAGVFCDVQILGEIFIGHCFQYHIMHVR